MPALPTDAAPPSDLTTVRRAPDRARYDAETVHAFLDAGSVGHVGFVADGRAIVIPMLYGRDGETLYLHGSVASRLMRHLDGKEASLAVTHVDALVMARSAFHHSMNYRSVVAFGTAQAVTDDDAKLHGLRVITEHMAPGRWDEVRAPNRVEMRQTSVLRLDIAEASAKTRTHGVNDDDEDLELPVWAGLVPVTQVLGEPVTDPQVAPGTEPSPSVVSLIHA